MKRIISIFILKSLLFILFQQELILAQGNKYISGRVDSNTAFNKRAEFRKHLYDNIIRKNLSLSLTSESEDKWIGAYWACKFSYCKDEFVKNSLKAALSQYDNKSQEFNRSTLETIYTLFPTGFENEISELIEKIKSSKDFAIAVSYILRANSGNLSLAEKYHHILSKKFKKWDDDPILIMLDYKLSLNERKEKTDHPPIRDLITDSVWNGKNVILSFQRKNRDFEGITVIRNSDGKFLRDSSGNIFHISHLARALSNLPGFLTNGNTPVGIFSIIKVDTSDNQFIGKTPFIVTALPFEVTPDIFFKDPRLKNIKWNKDLYQNLLTESWKSYLPIYESFYAGMAGRSEIVMHGTTIDPEFYKGYPYYPNTPSLGCITAKELYSQDEGKLIMSDQQDLIDHFNICKNKDGFLIVIELDDTNSKVEFNEILPVLLKSEN